jgi:hypothetical protein
MSTCGVETGHTPLVDPRKAFAGWPLHKRHSCADIALISLRRARQGSSIVLGLFGKTFRTPPLNEAQPGAVDPRLPPIGWPPHEGAEPVPPPVQTRGKL